MSMVYWPQRFLDSLVARSVAISLGLAALLKAKYPRNAFLMMDVIADLAELRGH